MIVIIEIPRSNQTKCSQLQSSYEQKLSEWGALEAIVQQQDRETTAASLARLGVDNEEKNESYPHSPTPDRPSTITEVNLSSL